MNQKTNVQQTRSSDEGKPCQACCKLIPPTATKCYLCGSSQKRLSRSFQLYFPPIVSSIMIAIAMYQLVMARQANVEAQDVLKQVNQALEQATIAKQTAEEALVDAERASTAATNARSMAMAASVDANDAVVSVSRTEKRTSQAEEELQELQNAVNVVHTETEKQLEQIKKASEFTRVIVGALGNDRKCCLKINEIAASAGPNQRTAYDVIHCIRSRNENLITLSMGYTPVSFLEDDFSKIEYNDVLNRYNNSSPYGRRWVVRRVWDNTEISARQKYRLMIAVIESEPNMLVVHQAMAEIHNRQKSGMDFFNPDYYVELDSHKFSGSD